MLRSLICVLFLFLIGSVGYSQLINKLDYNNILQYNQYIYDSIKVDGNIRSKKIIIKKYCNGNYKNIYTEVIRSYTDKYNIKMPIGMYTKFYKNKNIHVLCNYVIEGNYEYKEFYRNGQIKEEGYFLNNTNKKIGKWKLYSKDGKLKKEKTYK